MDEDRRVHEDDDDRHGEERAPEPLVHCIVLSAARDTLAMLVALAALVLASVPGRSDANVAADPLIGGVLWMGDSIAYDSTNDRYASMFASCGIGASNRDSCHTTTPAPESSLLGRTAVVFVTAPPIDPAATPPGWPENWRDLTRVAEQVASEHPGRVFLVDSSEASGEEYIELAEDGTPLRKPDGVHVCPLGATIFGDFLVRWLDEHYAGVAPVDPEEWPQDWWFDGRYYLPPDVCSAR